MKSSLVNHLKRSTTMSKDNKIAVAENKLPSTNVLDFSADAGAGLEGADKDSFALPFITILQGLSPQMETVEGAKLGKFINTITNGLSDKVDVVPVAFQRRYLEWAPRAKGGGFHGSHEVLEVESKNYGRDENNQLVNEAGNLLKDTRIHYVLVVNESGSFSPAIISLSSTQIKKSKRWLSLIQNIQMKDSAGRTFNPPAFSHIYTLSSLKESNDSGSWYGISVAMKKPVEDGQLYAAAKALNAQVASGAVTASAPPEAEAPVGDDKF
jgi:hypothetical protein